MELKRYDYSGGNVWGGISADISRQIVYVSTGECRVLCINFLPI